MTTTQPSPRAAPISLDFETAAPRFAGLAESLAAHGPRAVEHALARFAARARRRGVDPLLLAILTDPTQPDVARERAFGRITVDLRRDRAR